MATKNLIKSVDIPQVRSLAQVREVLQAIHDGHVDISDIEKITGIKPRHVSYATHAARVIGFLTMQQENVKATDLGVKLLDTVVGSSLEKDIFLQGINGSPTIQSVAPEILDSKPISKNDLTRRIADIARLSHSTALHRAGALLSWQQELCSRQVELFPQEKTSRKEQSGSRRLAQLPLSVQGSPADPPKTAAKIEKKIKHRKNNKHTEILRRKGTKKTSPLPTEFPLSEQIRPKNATNVSAKIEETKQKSKDSHTRTLILPSTLEDIRSRLNSSGATYASKLMEFVRPVDDTERTIAEITAQMKGASGRAILLYGPPGTGKSTFIESLKWRPHLGISDLKQINCSELDPNHLLDEVLRQLQDLAKATRQAGTTTVVSIDYLEDLEGQKPAHVKAFFRALNGLLRSSALFVIWSVTDRTDADRMLGYASDVSGTVFPSGKEIITFRGPDRRYFPSIAKNTIAVLNDGLAIEDFGLTDADLDDLNKESSRTIREYLVNIVTCWQERSNYLEKLYRTIPKPTEIWTIFAYPDAEGIVSQFSRHSEAENEAWTAFHSKLWEYIPNSQRRADWDPKRLQLAINGSLKTRIMYLPTNVVVCAIAAYAQKIAAQLGFSKLGVPPRWANKSSAQERIQRTAVYRLLVGERIPPGKRRGIGAAQGVAMASRAFEALTRHTVGSGNDRLLNQAIATALKDSLGSAFSISAETPHPWIPNINPDIRIDTPDQRHICLELCYTSRSEPHIVADYVLHKLDRYMRQLELYLKSD